jgi:hypothetical protein
MTQIEVLETPDGSKKAFFILEMRSRGENLSRAMAHP